MRLSAAKWPDDFEIFDPPKFVRLAEQACAHLGIESYRVKDGGFDAPSNGR